MLRFAGSAAFFVLVLALLAALFAVLAACILFVPGLLGGGAFGVLAGIGCAAGVCLLADRLVDWP